MAYMHLTALAFLATALPAMAQDQEVEREEERKPKTEKVWMIKTSGIGG